MTEGFNLGEDLASMTDATEPVALLRRCGPAAWPVPHALRRGAVASEAAASGGACLRAEARWHLPEAELPEPPRVGDWLLDAAGTRWTLLEVRRAAGRFTCKAVAQGLAAGLDRLVTIQEALPPGASGARTTWRDLWAGVPAHVEPAAGSDATAPAGAVRITLGQPLPLGAAHRIVGPDGSVYQVTGCEDMQRLDALPVVHALRLAPCVV